MKHMKQSFVSLGPQRVVGPAQGISRDTPPENPTLWWMTERRFIEKQTRQTINATRIKQTSVDDQTQHMTQQNKHCCWGHVETRPTRPSDHSAPGPC